MVVAFAIAIAVTPSSSAKQQMPLEDRLEAQQRLLDLGYWAGSVDGVLDIRFRHALIAFQKVEDRERTGRLTSQELQALLTATRPLARITGYPHVEVDLRRQVLFIVNGVTPSREFFPSARVTESYTRKWTNSSRVHATGQV
jgi:peptidoglycan hydrolase-like protein with peptidoglycan-binding domain